MNPYKSNNIRFILGLVLIILIYSVYYLYFIDNIDFIFSRKARHAATFLTTLIIYFIGTFHLGKLSDSWMSFIWHIVHISGLFILTSIGLYDWFIGETSLNIRSFAKSIQELLISPVLYVGMGVINSTLNKN